MLRLFRPAIILMDRLRYPQKFLLIGLLIGLPLGWVFYEYEDGTSYDIDFAEQERLGVAYVTPVENLLELVEEHMVLAALQSQGGTDFGDLPAVHEQISVTLIEIDQVDQSLGSQLQVAQEWRNVRAEWERLNTDISGLSDREIVDRHKLLIDQMLNLIVMIGNNSKLVLDPDLDTYYLMHTVIIQTPRATAYYSQAQVDILNAVLNQNLDDEARSRLIVYSGLGQSVLEANRQGLNYAYEVNPALRDNLLDAQQTSYDSFIPFEASVNTQLLSDTTAKVSAQQIYSITSAALDARFRFNDAALAELDRLLQIRIQHLAAKRAIAIVGALVALAFSTYLCAGFYLGVRQTIDSLEHASRQMVLGNLTALTLDNHDELSEVVISFNNIARELVEARDRALETNRAENAAVLARSNDLITSLAEVASRLVTTLDLNSIWETIGTEFRKLGLHILIRLVSDDDKMLVTDYTTLKQPLQPEIQQMIDARSTHLSSLLSLDYNTMRQGFEAVKIDLEADSVAFLTKALVPNHVVTNILDLLDSIGINDNTTAFFYPLLLDEQLVGTLTIWGDSSKLKRSDAPAVSVFAGEVAVAIRNARLYQAEHEQRVLAETLQRTTAALLRTIETDDTIKLILDHLAEVVAYDQAALMLVEGNELRQIAARGMPESKAHENKLYTYSTDRFLRQALGDARPLMIPNIQEHLDRGDLPGVVPSTRSWMAVPLITWGVVTGLLTVGFNEQNYFTERTLQAAAAFAQQAAVAMENVRLVTELSAMVFNLREAQERLTRSARLAAAGEIAAGVAHQINNPLAAIMADVTLILRDISPEDQNYESAVAIKEAAMLAGKVVERQLNLSRSIPYDLQQVDVNQSINSAVALVQAQISPVASLDVSLASSLPLITASAEHLSDVWLNMLLNARDALAGRDHAVIHVSTALSSDGDEILIAIKDNGQGISQEHIGRIFDPFFTTKVRGHGLGLPICYEVIRRHRGNIVVDSQEGVGTTMCITLPISTISAR